jgi:hypothetical protein
MLREQVGASVYSTANLGNGFPDLCVGFRHMNYLFELKNPMLVPSARALTEDELIWHRAWQGQVDRVETPLEILKILGLI